MNKRVKRAARIVSRQAPPDVSGPTRLIKSPGRPKKPPPEPRKPVIIEVYDLRPHLRAPKLVGRHENVPPDWSVLMILKKLGIAEHLTVYRIDENGRSVIRHALL